MDILNNYPSDDNQKVYIKFNSYFFISGRFVMKYLAVNPNSLKLWNYNND